MYRHFYFRLCDMADFASFANSGDRFCRIEKYRNDSAEYGQAWRLSFFWFQVCQSVRWQCSGSAGGARVLRTRKTSAFIWEAIFCECRKSPRLRSMLAADERGTASRFSCHGPPSTVASSRGLGFGRVSIDWQRQRRVVIVKMTLQHVPDWTTSSFRSILVLVRRELTVQRRHHRISHLSHRSS